ncbi:MAG: transglutaminase-like domain-containing protein [Marinobacter sp.]
MTLAINVHAVKPGALLLAPIGITTPYDSVNSARVEGARIVEVLMEPELCSGALLVEATKDSVRFVHQISPASPTATYPEPAFVPRRNRYMEASEELAAASRDIAIAAGGGTEGIKALVAETESRFSYTHPEIRFNDGADKVPHLSCGLTPGSCVDINTYLVASLRAAGYEAGYIYGYFFPRGRGGVTNDMHCWVITRHNGAILEWDIAHHIKAGLGETGPGLNPRPGHRVGLGHSMGHLYTIGDRETVDLKLLGEPLMLSDMGCWNKCQITVHSAVE